MPFEDGKPDLAISSGGHFEDEEPSSSLWRRLVADPAISLIGKGSIGVPETAVGLADLVTGGYAGKAAEAVGFRPKEAKEYLDTLLSPEQQEANRYVQEAEGFFPTIGRALERPSTIAHSVLESLPSVGAGGVVARGAMKAAPKLKPLVAGAAGEGTVSAGLTAEQVRQQTPTGTISLPQVALAAGSGAATMGFGVAGGKLAHRLGIADIDTLIAAGKLPEGARKSLARRIGEGIFIEGPIEELPQSLQEQIAQNLALGEPWQKGTPQAGAMGMLAGSVMGGGVATLTPTKPPVQEILDRNPDSRKAAEELLQKAAEDVIQGTDTLAGNKQETPTDESQQLPAPGEQAAPEATPEAGQAQEVTPISGAMPKTVGGIPVSAQSVEQLRAIAQDPEANANTRRAALAALNPPVPPVAESQVPVAVSGESQGDRGVAPTQEGGLPEVAMAVQDIQTTEKMRLAIEAVGEDEFRRQAQTKIEKYKPINPKAEAMLVEATATEILAIQNLGSTEQAPSVSNIAPVSVQEPVSAPAETAQPAEIPPAPAAQPSPAVPKPQPEAASPVEPVIAPETPAIAPKPEESRQIVETFTGQYKKGLGSTVARQQQKRLSAEKPTLTWEIEPAPEFGEQRFKVVGYAPVEAISLEGAKAAISPEGDAREVKEPWQMTRKEFIDVGPEGYSAKGDYGWSKTGGDHGAAVADAISENKPVPAEVLADYPDLKQAETAKAPEAKPVETEKASAERAGLYVAKPEEYAKFAPWVGNRLKEAEAKGEKAILTLGTSRDYTIYEKGHRSSFDGDGTNKGQILGETSGNPVEIATRHGEENIIAMTSAAKKEIDERRTELEAKRAAEDERQQKMQDDLARTTEERRKYFETVATVQLPKGVKKTITVKSQKGEKLELTGTDYDGLFIHKIDNKNEPYSVTDTKSGLRIARFPRVDQAKDFIRGVIHANLPRADITKLSKAELAQWVEVAKTHMAGDEVPKYFTEQAARATEPAAEPAPPAPETPAQPAPTIAEMSPADLLRAAADKMDSEAAAKPAPSEPSATPAPESAASRSETTTTPAETPAEGEQAIESDEVASAQSITPEIKSSLDAVLSDQDKADAVKELGVPEWSDKTADTFLARYAEWLQQGAKDLGTKLSALFRKVLDAARGRRATPRRETDKGTETKFAKGEGIGITESTLRAEIAKAFGPRAERLVGDILIPLNTQADIAGVSELADVALQIREGDLIKGFYHPMTGKTYAILENLDPGDGKGLVLHEIGVHLGLGGMLGQENYAKLLRQMDTMRKAGNKVVIEAHEQATAQAVSEDQIPEESIAYLVTYAPQLPFVQRIISQIKAFLFRKFGILGDRLTPDDIATLAKASVLHASEEVRGGEAQFSRAQDQTQTEAESLAQSWRSRTWANETEARDMIKRRIIEDNERYPMFSATDPAIVDQLRFTRAKGGSVKLVAKRDARLQPNWSEDRPENAPDVDWTARDNQDEGTPASIKKEFGRARGNLYQAWIPTDELPAAKGEDIRAGALDQDSGQREEMAHRGRANPPPLKVRIGPRGKVELLDGNHRLAYWNERGHSHVPAWVLDERPEAQQPSNIRFQRTNEQGAVKRMKQAIPQLARNRMGEIADYLIYNYQDKFHMLPRIQKRLYEGTLPESMDANLAVEAYPKMVSARIQDFHDDYVEPFVKLLHGSNLTIDQAQEYVNAKDAPDRNREMKARNPTKAELDAMKAGLAAERDALSSEDSVQEYVAKRRELRQTEADVEDGIADQSTVEVLKEAISALRKDPVVKDYATAVDKLKALQAIKPFEGDNTALSGMSDAKAEEIIAKARKDGTFETMEKVSAAVDAITARTRQVLLENGLAKSDEITAWEALYPHYVPRFRDEVTEGIPHPTGQGFQVRGKESKRATGSTKEVINILAHVMTAHEAAIIRSEKVKADRALYNLFATHPENDVAELDIAPKLRDVDAKTGLVIERVDPLYKQKPNVLILKIDGDEHTITFNEDNPEALRLAASMKNLSSQDIGEITAIVGKFTRFLATMNTAANPVFTLRNFMRDTGTAFVNLTDTELAGMKKQVFADLPKSIKGFWEMTRGNMDSEQAKLAREFRDAGGQTGFVQHYKDIIQRAETLEKQLADLGPGKMKFTKRLALSYWHLIEDANLAVENGVRLSAYANARKAGLSQARAISLSNNLTVNFTKHGARGQELNMWYMFMNASIQGTARLVKAMGTRQVQKILGYVIASAFLLDMLNRSLAGDDDDDGENDYDQLPDYVKGNNFVFYFGRPITLPMPYGYNFFASVGRMMSEAMWRKNYSPAKSAVNLANVFVDAFSPMGQSSDLLQFAAPTIADPFIQWAQNRNFAGNPLRREQLPFGVPKPEYQMGFRSTSAPAKGLAEALNNMTGGNEVRPGLINLNPVAFDFAVTSILGGAGRSYLQAFSLPIKAALGDEIQAREVPVANIFASARPEYQVERKFVENLRAVQMVDAELKHYRNDPKQTALIREQYPGEMRLRERAKMVQKALTQIRKRERLLEKTQPPEWRERAKELTQRKRAWMSGFNKRYSELTQ